MSKTPYTTNDSTMLHIKTLSYCFRDKHLKQPKINVFTDTKADFWPRDIIPSRASQLGRKSGLHGRHIAGTQGYYQALSTIELCSQDKKPLKQEWTEHD